ncbi:MAG: helix-turn-helix domain-containing protein, partial [Candidatus Thiodiazotropha sp. 6PLUC3]
QTSGKETRWSKLFTRLLGSMVFPSRLVVCLTLTTVYNHLATAIESRGLPLAQVSTLSSEQLKAIRFAFEQFADDGKLKPVYEALEGVYDYGLLRCIQAALNVEASIATPE